MLTFSVRAANRISDGFKEEVVLVLKAQFGLRTSSRDCCAIRNMASKVPSTPSDVITKRVEHVKKSALAKKQIGLDWRRQQLRAVKAMLQENVDTVRFSYLCHWYLFRH